MADDLVVKGNSKQEKYQSLLPQIKSLVSAEKNLIANLSNITSALKYGMDFFWVGFYFVEGDELILGPFQGPVACTRIKFGKGVCGTSWKEKKTILVEDVEKFPGHIACSSMSKSEIVVPGFDSIGKVIFVLDVDAITLSCFNSIDQNYLEEICKLVSGLMSR